MSKSRSQKQADLYVSSFLNPAIHSNTVHDQLHIHETWRVRERCPPLGSATVVCPRGLGCREWKSERKMTTARKRHCGAPMSPWPRPRLGCSPTFSPGHHTWALGREPLAGACGEHQHARHARPECGRALWGVQHSLSVMPDLATWMGRALCYTDPCEQSSACAGRRPCRRSACKTDAM